MHVDVRWFCALVLMSSFFLGSFWSSPVSAGQPEAEILLARATLAYENEEFEQAKALLLEAIDQDPDNSRVLYYLGLVHLAQKQPAQAVPYLGKGLSIRPSNLFLRYQLGLAYFALPDYEKAAPPLFEVYEKQPTLDSLGFYVGYLLYRKKDYEGALAAFDANQTQDFDTQQLTLFYRGLTLGVLGLSDQAIEELEEVKLDRTVAPLSSAAIRVRERLAAKKKADETKPWQLQVSLGGFYDDNVSINPNSSSNAPDPNSTTREAGNQALRDLRNRDTKAPGFLATLRADYSFWREGPYEVSGNYSFFQTVNGNGLSELNIQDHLLGLSGFYRDVAFKLPYQVDLQYTFDYLLLDMSKFLARHTPTLSATVIPPSFTVPTLGSIGNLTSVLYRYRNQNFFKEEQGGVKKNIRDGHNNMLGLLHVFRFADDQFLFRIGYQYDNESTKAKEFSYSGNRLLTGGQWLIPWGGLTLRYDYDIHWRGYEKKQTFSPFTDKDGNLSKRKDTQHTHLVQLTKPLPYNLTLTVQYQGIYNKSKIRVYDYSKNLGTLILTWVY